ncbi:MAG TPA: DUF6178 family protein [Polyangia bacterium]|jgi:hypothetical protein|nr:DUF6178 family protein [Polyangia bacterium]
MADVREGSTPSSSEVIPLSRWRAVLARARRARRAEVLLEEPDAARLVPALPVQELYYLIKEVGIADAAELVALASTEQIQGFLDFDLWARDRLQSERSDAWLDALMEAGPIKLAATFKGLDQEIAVRYVETQLRVYDLSQEAPPEEPEGHFYPTPDGAFLLDVLAEGERGKRVERMIDWLYRVDLQYAQKTLLAARWELPSDLEEWAYRWRSGRMADLGFAEYHEALEVYRWLEPASVQLGEGTTRKTHVTAAPTTLPLVLAESVGERGLLGQALAAIADAAELERLQAELMLLTNRVMSAEQIEPDDLEALPGVLRRVVATLDLGLEFLGRRGPDLVGQAVAALGSVALVRIFRVGFSLTLKLRHAADTLSGRGWVTLVPGRLTLLDTPLREILGALREPRPLYSLALEGGAAEATRPFATLADLARAARTIEEAAAIGPFLRDGLGVAPRLLAAEVLVGCRPAREDITFAVMGATLMANLLLDRPPALVPLAPEDIETLRERVLPDGPPLRPTTRLQVLRAFEERLTERGLTPPAEWTRWVEGWLEHLGETLALASAAEIASDPGRGGGLLVRVREAPSDARLPQ